MNEHRVCQLMTLTGSAFLVVLAVGCGKADPNRGIVAGKVTLDGRPLDRGTIQFAPMVGTKGVATGGSIENGHYRLADVAAPAVGSNRVEIRATRPTGKKIPKPFAPPGEMIDELVAAVPPKYNSDSALKVDVKPGENTADFDLSAN